MKNTENALKWIVNILESKKVRFQITGGFAAGLYGSNRELADIDIDINDDDFEKITNEVKQYIIFGPEQFKDENWDLKLMTLEYEGQVIDICGESTIFDKNNNKWMLIKTDFSNSNHVNTYGIDIPVITKESLVAYKSKLLRNVDVEDIEALNNFGSNFVQ